MERHLLFTSRHCARCPQMRQNLLTAGVPFESISVDDRDGALRAQQYRIMALPSLLVVRNGAPHKVIPGLCSPAQILEAIG